MSVWLGRFKLPDVENAEYVVPCAYQLKQLRNVGLNPEEWLLARLPCGLPFVVLRKRCADSVYIVLSRRVF